MSLASDGWVGGMPRESSASVGFVEGGAALSSLAAGSASCANPMKAPAIKAPFFSMRISCVKRFLQGNYRHAQFGDGIPLVEALNLTRYGGEARYEAMV